MASTYFHLSSRSVRSAHSQTLSSRMGTMRQAYYYDSDREFEIAKCSRNIFTYIFRVAHILKCFFCLFVTIVALIILHIDCEGLGEWQSIGIVFQNILKVNILFEYFYLYYLTLSSLYYRCLLYFRQFELSSNITAVSCEKFILKYKNNAAAM